MGREIAPIRIPWRRDLRHPATAPRDGTRFLAIAKGKAEPARFRWDGEMDCFLSDDFALVDELACWWPEPPTAKAPQE